ncbi:MAG: hypothetical protein SynsKO_26170 [Synoicihabitans sp.]
MSDPRVERFRALVAQHPTNEMFRFSLAQALDAAGEQAEAEKNYLACVESKADWMLPRILLGKLRLKANDRDGAKALFVEALELAITQDHEDPAQELEQLLADLE